MFCILQLCSITEKPHLLQLTEAETLHLLLTASYIATLLSNELLKKKAKMLNVQNSGTLMIKKQTNCMVVCSMPSQKLRSLNTKHTPVAD